MCQCLQSTVRLANECANIDNEADDHILRMLIMRIRPATYGKNSTASALAVLVMVWCVSVALRWSIVGRAACCQVCSQAGAWAGPWFRVRRVGYDEHTNPRSISAGAKSMSSRSKSTTNLELVCPRSLQTARGNEHPGASDLSVTISFHFVLATGVYKRFREMMMMMMM